MALRLAGRNKEVVWPVRTIARLVSAYLRSPIRDLAGEDVASWLLDIVLDRPIRFFAFSMLGRKRSARFRADARDMAAESSGWRGNLLVNGCWLLFATAIYSAYSASLA